MRKTTAFLAVSAALLIGILGFRYGANSSATAPASPKDPHSIPDQAIYRQLFHHHNALKKKADELQQQGKNGLELRSFYKQSAKLTDDQDRAFDQIASDCDRDVAKQDEKAQALITAVQRRYPKGRIPQGERPPEAPTELKAMQAERDDIILKARDRLRAAFGEQEFQRFSDFVEKNVKPHVTSEPLNRQRPQSTMGPHRQIHATNRGY